MSAVSAWYQYFRLDDETPARALLNELGRIGVELRNWQADERGGGIVFFRGCQPELLELVHDLSCGGLVRVMLVDLAANDSSGNGGWRLLKAGAADVLHAADLTITARAIHARFQRWHEVDRLIDSPLVQRNLIGSSRTWRSTLRTVVEAARFTDSPILILGESGTGKELLARLVHSLDPRGDKKDLIVLDCTTVVPELAGSEFFGHERGSYTGSVGTRDGAFARAHQGTLFLDEVGELPQRLQAQLLRVVQERTFKRVGGDRWQNTDFRLVAATNCDLTELMSAGQFRTDLYYRLASITCRVPPLRERADDIMPLFRHFFEELRPGTEVPQLDLEVQQLLLERAYPGNVRDLRQLVARIAFRYAGAGPITIGDVPESERPAPGDEPGDWRDGPFEWSIRRALLQGAGLREISRISADTAIRLAVEDADGNVRRAAQTLGVTDRALHMRRAAANGKAVEERTNGHH